MKYVMQLCEGRHPTPEKVGGIYPRNLPEVYMFNERELLDRANRNIPNDCDDLWLYVTGLTTAIMAVVTVCIARRISLTTLNYNKKEDRYIPQKVI